jgi:hypothetical protein
VEPPDVGGGEWVRIGDGPSTVLANGRFMLGASGYSGTTVQAILDASKLTWTATGTGKVDGNGEEGWSLLPNGDVLTVDTTDTSPRQNTELYSPKTGSWASAGKTPVPADRFRRRGGATGAAAERHGVCRGVHAEYRRLFEQVGHMDGGTRLPGHRRGSICVRGPCGRRIARRRRVGRRQSRRVPDTDSFKTPPMATTIRARPISRWCVSRSARAATCSTLARTV